MTNSTKTRKSTGAKTTRKRATPKAKVEAQAAVTESVTTEAVAPVPAGRTNVELLARREAAVPRGVASAAPIFAARAENAELWDVEGNRYIDFAGGIAVLNTGHRHPKVVDAAKAQEDLYTHTSFQVVPTSPMWPWPRS